MDVVVLEIRPVVAFLVALAVTPMMPVLLAAALERRIPVVEREYLAFLFGDVLLALAIALSVDLVDARLHSPAINATVVALIAGGFLAYGLWQWRHEVAQAVYSPAQALSPTKIWHQVVVYPVIGTWLVVAAALSVGQWIGHIGRAALIVVCLLGWIGLVAYDHQHLKLGHVPYEWHRLAPSPLPWRPESETLRADQQDHPGDYEVRTGQDPDSELHQYPPGLAQ